MVELSHGPRRGASDGSPLPSESTGPAPANVNGGPPSSYTLFPCPSPTTATTATTAATAATALRRRVDGVSEKMLSQTLQALERDGIAHREVITTIPPRVEYTLTPLGVAVAERVRGLAELLESAVPQITAAREAHAKAQAAVPNGDM